MMHSRLILPSKREVGEDTKSHEKWPVPDAFSVSKAVIFTAMVEVFPPPISQTMHHPTARPAEAVIIAVVITAIASEV